LVFFPEMPMRLQSNSAAPAVGQLVSATLPAVVQVSVAGGMDKPVFPSPADSQGVVVSK
jgi:hypothetical protein